MELYKNMIIEMIKQMTSRKDLQRIYDLVSYLYIHADFNPVPKSSESIQ